MTDRKKVFAVLLTVLLVGAAGSAIALTDHGPQADQQRAQATNASNAANAANMTNATASPDVDPKAREVLQRAAQSVSEIDYVSGKATTTVTSDGESATSEMRFYVDRQRSESGVQVLSPEGAAGDTVIANGTSATVYDASENKAYVADSSDVQRLRDANRSEMMNDTNRSEVMEQMPASVTKQLPPGAMNRAPQSTDGAQSMATDLANNTTVTYEGTATVDGTETVVLKVNVGDRATVTLYHDAETYLPQKIVVEANGTTSVTTFCYEQIDYCPNDRAAPFGIPEDATVVPAEQAAESAS